MSMKPTSEMYFVIEQQNGLPFSSFFMGLAGTWGALASAYEYVTEGHASENIERLIQSDREGRTYRVVGILEELSDDS